MNRTRRKHRRNYNITGHAHVLTFSCYRSYEFLRSDRTCQWLVEAIDDARRKLDFELRAYVFTPKHVHLIVFPLPKNYDIARIRHAIKHPVGEKAVRFLAQESPEWLQRITRRRGQKTERLFWQSGGGYDRNIDEPTTLAREIEYLHMNPVRRGLVERAVDWNWSSAGWFEGRASTLLAPDTIPAEWIT